jgi:hypothetical protein
VVAPVAIVPSLRDGWFRPSWVISVAGFPSWLLVAVAVVLPVAEVTRVQSYTIKNMD